MALPQRRREVFLGPGPAWSTTVGDPTDRAAARASSTPAFTRRDRVIVDQLGISNVGSPADVAAPVPWGDNSYTRYNRLVVPTAPPTTAGDVELARATFGRLGDRVRAAARALLGG